MFRSIPLLCPVCRQPLLEEERALRCPQGHAFDVAREGYVNLLRLRKQPKFLGDSKEMLRARRAFLQSGHYAPIVRALHRAVDAHLRAGNTHGCILDAGCGEGSYLGQLHAHLQTEFGERAPACCGMDIAKEGVRLAARQYPESGFVVADTTQPLLLPDASVRVLLNIFAPRNAAEFARVVGPGGLLLVLIPGQDHLIELRDALGLLDVEPQKRTRVVAQFAQAFQLVDTQPVHFAMELAQDELVQLVEMTPSARHLSEKARDSLRALTHFTTSARVELLLFQRR